VAKKE